MREFINKKFKKLAVIASIATMLVGFPSCGKKETESNMTDIRKEDRLIKRETGLSNSRINGANNTRVNGNNIKPDILEQLQNNM